MTDHLATPDTAACGTELLVQDEAAVRTLVLNRPRVLNAFSREMYRSVADALESAQGDTAVSVVIVTGSGRAFSSGVDLRELGTHPRRRPLSISPRSACARISIDQLVV